MRWLLRYRFRQTTVLLGGCLAFLSGVGLAHGGYSLGVQWCIIAASFSLLAWRRRDLWLLLLVIFFGLSLGWWHGSLAMQKLAAYQPYYEQKVVLTVQALDDGVYNAHDQLAFDADHIVMDDGTPLAGKLEVSGFGTNAVFQGDTVQVSGKLYSGFGAYQGYIGYAQLDVTAHHASLVTDLRRRFTAGMQSALPEPLAPFAMGLLVGQRATLPATAKQDLLMVGLTHIIAVSGYNLTIMLQASRRLFARRSKRLATLLSLALISVFLLFAGASASIVRAAIVSVLTIFASYYGRNFRPLTLLALAAAITAWASPFYVWSDTSWYLSFLAFFGVMVLAPLLQTRLRPRWRKSLLMAVALESVCAEIMTLPFVLRTFGQMSLIGLPANVLVVALVPLAMLLSLVAGITGMLAAPLSGWFAWPARILLTYMLDVAHILARIPHIFLQNLSLSISGMLMLYALTITLTFLLSQKTKGLKSATITDREELISKEYRLERSLEMVND